MEGGKSDITPITPQFRKKQVEIYLNRDVSAVIDDEESVAYMTVARFSAIIEHLNNDLFVFFELKQVTDSDGVVLWHWDGSEEQNAAYTSESIRGVFRYELTLSGFKCQVYEHTDEDGDTAKMYVELDETENDLSVFLKRFKEYRDETGSFEYHWRDEYDKPLFNDFSGESPQLIFKRECDFYH